MQSKSLTTIPEREQGAVVPRQRLLDIDRAKAMAIIFVVLGHISAPQGPEWADVLRTLIYNFHMPFFMYLSGFVFVYASSHLIKRSFRNYVLNRVNRLLVPFFLMAIVIITLKMLGSHYTDINRSVITFIDAYQFILIHTQQSPALDLWYLFVLFVFSVTTPILYMLFRLQFWPLLLISAFMYALFVNAVTDDSLTDDFYVSRICWFYVFFIVGCMTCRHSGRWLPFVDRTWPIALILFILSDIGTLGFWMLETPWRYLIVGLLSTIGIHGLVRSQIFAGDRLLLFIADSTLAIYLFNTTFIAAGRAITSGIASPTNDMWLFYAVCVPVGLIGPIVVRHFLLHFRMTRPVAVYLS